MVMNFPVILSFDFTGEEERFVRFENECIGSCNVDALSHRIEIISDSYFLLKV
jgi:hypothetical protein